MVCDGPSILELNYYTNVWTISHWNKAILSLSGDS